MQKTILYAVLNWGLGHVTRSIPIIHHLIEEGHKLIIASDGVALSLLEKEFPRQTIFTTQTYDVVYAKDGEKFSTAMAMQIPKFISAIKKEHKDCLELCDEYDVDYIISDNRYGFYHDAIPSAFICHQLHLLYPDSRLFEMIVNKSYQGFLKKFSQLWVPDNEPPNNLTGRMSKLKWNNVHYVGIESRLEHKESDPKYDCLCILSGPEPQRSLMEAELLIKLKERDGNHCLIRGADNLEKIEEDNIQVIDLATSKELEQLINSSKMVVCRSGYTSVMDLLKLKKPAILVPTPGQVEQEFLAKSLDEKGWFQSSSQDDIVLEWDVSYKLPDLKTGYDYSILQQFLSC